MAAAGEMLSPAEVGAIVVEAIGREEFLILPHPEVRDYATRPRGERALAARHAAPVGGFSLGDSLGSGRG